MKGGLQSGAVVERRPDGDAAAFGGRAVAWALCESGGADDAVAGVDAGSADAETAATAVGGGGAADGGGAGACEATGDRKGGDPDLLAGWPRAAVARRTRSPSAAATAPATTTTAMINPGVHVRAGTPAARFVREAATSFDASAGEAPIATSGAKAAGGGAGGACSGREASDSSRMSWLSSIFDFFGAFFYFLCCCCCWLLLAPP